MPLWFAVVALLIALAVAAIGSSTGAISQAAAQAAARLGVVCVVVAAALLAGGVRIGRVRGFWHLVRQGLWLLCGAYVCAALDTLGMPGPWAVAGLVLLLCACSFLFSALAKRALREEGSAGGLATLLDVAILVCSLTVASMPLVLIPLADQQGSLSLASGITWVANAGLFGGAVWLLYRLPRGRDTRSIALLVVALGTASVLNLARASLQIHGAPMVPWWLTAFSAVPFALVALAPRLEPAEVHDSPLAIDAFRWLTARTALPYVAFLPLLALWFVSIGLGWDLRLYGTGIAVVATLVVARQLLLLRDHHAVLVERARQALVDQLTRVRNRRAFDEDLSQLLDIASRRHRGDLVVLLVDLDELKAINDRDGHAAGDRALVTVAAALTAGARTSDRVYRIGGDEFAMLLPDGGGDGAIRVLADARERLRSGVDSVSVSAGLATFPEDGGDAPGLLLAADQRLYRSKRSRGPEQASVSAPRPAGHPQSAAAALP
jgi:diguanylate cyclase (GGDEF)-like protein